MEGAWDSVPSGVRKVLGGHKDGAPIWLLPAGGEGDVDVRVDRFHQAGASGCFLSTWGVIPPRPSVSSCPFLSTLPCPQEVWSSTDLLGPGWGEAWSWGS